MPRALIIDDDPGANNLLAECLRRLSFEPAQAFNGSDGLLMVEEKPPDIIFLDVMLPDIHGYRVCEILKLSRETNPIPVVLVTGLAERQDRIQGFRVGADVHLAKPFTPAELRVAISAAHEFRQRLLQQAVDVYLRVDITSETQSLNVVNELFALILRHTTFDDYQVAQVRTALLEMGQNAIEWGNRYDRDKLVTITTSILHDRLEITIRDQGQGFRRDDLPHAAKIDSDPTSHLSVREALGIRQGGFGILMTHGLVDAVIYNDIGNEVTIVKLFNPVRQNQHQM